MNAGKETIVVCAKSPNVEAFGVVATESINIGPFVENLKNVSSPSLRIFHIFLGGALTELNMMRGRGRGRGRERLGRRRGFLSIRVVHWKREKIIIEKSNDQREKWGFGEIKCLEKDDTYHVKGRDKLNI